MRSGAGVRRCEKMTFWRGAVGATLVVALGGHKGRPYNAHTTPVPVSGRSLPAG
jgi:hypothetical protein